MCFTVSIYAQTHEIETDLGAVFDEPGAYHPYFHVTGFVHPNLPFVTNDRPDAIQLLQWGLIPHWVKDREGAMSIAAKTLNARSDTMYEKPSYRDAVKSKRGLLPVNGFIEWRHEGTLKQPYLVRSARSELMTLGCLWSQWTDKASGEILRTFTIVTTDANELMSYVHNNKQRMPVIVRGLDRKRWLEDDDRESVERLASPLPEGELSAHPLSRDVSRVKVNDVDEGLLEPIGDARL
jgi:putative SOS response-associated peptidase YedK